MLTIEKFSPRSTKVLILGDSKEHQSGGTGAPGLVLRGHLFPRATLLDDREEVMISS